MWKQHLLKIANISVAIFRCMSLFKRNIFNWIQDFGLHKWNIYTDSICTSANTRRFSPVAVRLIKHRPDGHRPICIEIFESSLLFSHIVRTVAVEIVRFEFQTKKRPVPVRCVQKLYGARPIAFYPQWPNKMPYRRRGILSNNWTSTGIVWCLKNDKKCTLLPAAGRAQ